MTFTQLFAAWPWKPIPNCPGRFVLPPSTLTPHDLAGDAHTFSEYRVPSARDPVAVAAIDDGGVISYRRADGSYVHTLNTPEGFERKLATLGLPANL